MTIMVNWIADFRRRRRLRKLQRDLGDFDWQKAAEGLNSFIKAHEKVMTAWQTDAERLLKAFKRATQSIEGENK